MSNGIQRSFSQRQKVKNISERVDDIEKSIPRLASGVNDALVGQNDRIQDLAVLVEAVTEILGTEVVDAKLKEIKERKILQSLESAKTALNSSLEKGEVVKADVIGEKSLIVGREFEANGETRFPGRVQIAWTGLKPEFQEKLKDQTPGFVVEVDGGGKFEVLEVYDVLPQSAAPAAESPSEN